MRDDELIVLANSKRYARRPARIRKALYFRDPKYAGLWDGAN
jgi:type IV secretory pathway TraG/TraD family ATPase VirD4